MTSPSSRGRADAEASLRLLLCGGAAALLDRLAAEPGAPRVAAIKAAGPTRDMVAAASRADLALVAVDARKGMSALDRRQVHVAALAGIRRAVLAVDGIDPGDRDREALAAIADEFRAVAREAGIELTVALPVSALAWEHLAAMPGGDGVAVAEPPPEPADQFAAHLIWMDERPMLPGRPYRLRVAGLEALAQVTDLAYRIDLDTLGRLAAKTLGADEIGYCKIALDRPVPFDSGAFTLTDRFTGETVGAGGIRFALRRAANVGWQETGIDKRARARALGQDPCVLWLTGLPGAGKSTIADRVERKLQARGRHTYLLDGNNLRRGLNRDLGFTDRDRVENIRRVAELAKLMVDAGLIVIVSLISPFRSERRMARETMEDGEFFEIFVDTPIEVCEARDPRGLYAKARRGELANFTGIDSPYEPPEAPDLRIDTTGLPADEAAEAVLGLLQSREPGTTRHRG